jgi:hypothetical protein
MPVSVVFRAVRYISLLVVMAFVWLLLGMVYLDHYMKPFDRLIPWLMPWKGPGVISGEVTVEKRISMMQGQLDASNKAANYAFLVMLASFAALCIYLTLVYQQKQRRARENELLSKESGDCAAMNLFATYLPP